MIKSLVISLAKKYIIGSINDLLNKNKDNIKVIIDKIQLWIDRLNKITGGLKNILNRVYDGIIDDKDVMNSKKDIETIIKEWK